MATNMKFRFDIEIVGVGAYVFVAEMYEVVGKTEIVHLTEKKVIHSFMEGQREISRRTAEYAALVREAIAALPAKPRKPAVRKNKQEAARLIDGVLTYADGSRVINGVRITNDK